MQPAALPAGAEARAASALAVPAHARCDILSFCLVQELLSSVIAYLQEAGGSGKQLSGHGTYLMQKPRLLQSMMHGLLQQVGSKSMPALLLSPQTCL